MARQQVELCVTHDFAEGYLAPPLRTENITIFALWVTRKKGQIQLHFLMISIIGSILSIADSKRRPGTSTANINLTRVENHMIWVTTTKKSCMTFLKGMDLEIDIFSYVAVYKYKNRRNFLKDLIFSEWWHFHCEAGNMLNTFLFVCVTIISTFSSWKALFWLEHRWSKTRYVSVIINGLAAERLHPEIIKQYKNRLWVALPKWPWL